jgi:hypothetical protein
MKCEEFEAVGLGLDRESGAEGQGLDPAEFAAAIEHANACPRCAALEESWQEARAELQVLREVTQGAGAPLRVEMRLRQELWAKRRAMKVRAFALMGAWVLASAALLIVGMSWWNWHIAQENIPLQSVDTPRKGSGEVSTTMKNSATPVSSTPTGANAEAAENVPTDSASDGTLVAANDAEDFTLLPGSLPQETGDASVVRVRLQRGALGALGLPVNEERAGEWIQVDLFVGQDGQPQAVRLPQ